MALCPNLIFLLAFSGKSAGRRKRARILRRQRTLDSIDIHKTFVTQCPQGFDTILEDCKAYKFVLNKLPVLARLDLSQNALESVDSYVFKDCDHLQELNLRANRLQALSADAFEKCPKLKRLDLADNQLTSLGPALTLLGALRSVNLTGNGLEELNWTQFPPDLLEILANDNKIRRIATLGQSETEEAGGGDGRKLKKLELKRNLIARLSTDALPLALEELDLSENQLTHVANSSFHGMAQLKTVNLRANKLRTIPRQLFDQTVGANAPFGRLWIAENPLECNCEMGWLLNASKEGTAGTGGVRDIAEAECVVPLTGQRKPVAQAMPSDFLCPYSQICEPGCLCCQYQNCDCKSRCPKGCQCFRDWHSATNVVKCSGQQANQEEFSLRELPMQASHILLSGLNIPVLQSHDFLGRDRLHELHVNSSQIQTIQPSAFNTLMNLKSLHLADNKLKHFNGDEGYRTLNIRLLNLANNQIQALDTRLIAMAPQLEQLFLEGNVFEELPTYLRSPSGDQLRQLSLAANPFRCDCSYTGRFDTPHWLARNRLRVIDADRVQCVENVTRAIQRNDTTILTGLPNVDDDLFAMSMFRFLDEENRTLCVDHTGVFGIGGPFDVLMFFMAMAALLLLLPMLMLLLIRPKWFESMLKDPKELRKTRKQQEQPLLKENNNSLSSTHSPTINGNSPLPPKPTVCHGVCDTFVCYSIKDEQMVREFRKRYSNVFNNICLLHECGAYQADRAYISDSLENLIKNSRLLVLFLSHEFMETEWNMPQLSTCLKTHFKGKSHILFILSNEMDERDKDNLPDELGKNIRISSPGCRTLTIAQNHPRFWAEIDEILYGILGETTARYGSPALSDTSESHIYSEYSQIPPVPSQML